MEAEPVQRLGAPVSQERKDQFRSDNSEEAIQACYDLIVSGHSLSEILVALKRVGPLNTVSQPERGGRPGDIQISQVASELRAASPGWQTAQITRPIESRLLDQAQGLSGALVPTDCDAPYSLVGLRVQQCAHAESGAGIKKFRSIGAVLFWLIPAISLMVVGIAGKLLINGELTRTAAEAQTAPKAIARIVQIPAEDLNAPRTDAIEARAPVPALAEVSRTAPEIIPTHPPMPNSPPATRRQRSTPPRHTRIQRPFPMEWKTPNSLTGGLY